MAHDKNPKRSPLRLCFRFVEHMEQKHKQLVYENRLAAFLVPAS